MLEQLDKEKIMMVYMIKVLEPYSLLIDHQMLMMLI